MALNIPAQFRAGDTLIFSDSLENYAAPAWALNYAIANGETTSVIESSADGEGHAFSIHADRTKNWKPGVHRWQAFVANGETRLTVGSGEICILPNLAGDVGLQLTHVERTLAALETMLESLASKEQSSVQFNGRAYTLREIGDLLSWRDKYKADLSRMRTSEKIAQGYTKTGTVRVRF